MKKLIKITSILSMTLILMTSCEDRLEEEVFSFLSPSNYFQNAEEGYTGLLAITANYGRNELYTRDFIYATHLPTDDHHLGRDGFNNDRLELDYYTVSPQNNIVLNMYSEYYISIYKANSLIEALEGNTYSQEEEEIRIWQIAEAKFYRAFNYFNLVRFFGKVPIIINTGQLGMLDQIARSEVNDVYNQIILDFEYAKDNLPSRDKQRAGRPAATAATAYLAKVHLTIGNFTEARAFAKEVIDSGEYDLFPNFEDIYLNSNQNDGEHIFSIQHLGGTGFANLGTAWWSPAQIPGSGGKIPMNIRLRDAFEDGDERFDVTFKQTFNNYDIDARTIDDNFYLILNKWRIEPDTDRNLNYPILRYADVLLIYAEALNEVSGPTDDAYDAINKVRNRAGLEDLSGLSKDEFRDAIKQERRVEFVGEAKRYFDLKRWGTLIENANEEFDERGMDNTATSTDVLLPIPQAELDRNKGLNNEQNPGY